MSITIKSGAKVLYQWERGVALTASTPCDILRISREDDRVTDDLYPVISGSTGTALIPDRMLTESGYLHVSRIDHADGSERVLETARILVRHAAKPQSTASSTKKIDDMQALRMQMAALERAAREGKFDGKDGTTPHIGGNGNWWLGDDDTGIAATGDDGITPHIGGNGNWYIGDADTGVKATGENGITPHIGSNGNWFIGEIDTGVNAKGDDGITPHIGENGNWYIGDEDTGVFARNEDVSLYADDMYTSGILEKGAMPLKILEPSGSNVIRYEIESAVVYIKGVRRARGGFTTSTQSVSFERLFANILRLNEEKGTFSWRVAEVARDGDNLVNIDNGEIYPARSGGYYDLIPYLVHVPAGVTSITYDMVEDLRDDERYCGYVRDRLAPTKVSELENDAGYVTDEQIENVITTEPQELTDAEKAQARANIGAAAVGEGGGSGGGVTNITSDMVTGALGYIPVTPQQLEATNETAAAAQKTAGEAKTLAEGASKPGHKHSAGDITSGTLPVARGGTGATDAATARTNLGITPANIGAMPAEPTIITVVDRGNFESVTVTKPDYSELSCISSNIISVSRSTESGDFNAACVEYNCIWVENGEDGTGTEITTDAIDFFGAEGKITGLGTPTEDDQAANKAYVDSKYSYGTEDLTAGTSPLESGKLYFVYE